MPGLRFYFIFLSYNVLETWTLPYLYYYLGAVLGCGFEICFTANEQRARSPDLIEGKGRRE